MGLSLSDFDPTNIAKDPVSAVFGPATGAVNQAGAGDAGEGFLQDRVMGGDAALAAEQAAALQAAGATEAIGFQRETRDLARADLAPFTQFGVDQLTAGSPLLFDPEAQFDFLQSNPIFNQALDQANQQTLNLASARGRTTAGDTQQQLSQNFLLQGLPILQGQQQNILNALNLGQASAAGQASTALTTGNTIADLITGKAAAEAAGKVGAANAEQQGINNLIQLAGLASGFA
jgi:hypothetical protein